MTIAMLLALTIMVAWLVIDHEMWERPEDPAERARAAQFNAATVVTLLIGVVFLYVGLLVVGFVAELIVLDHDVVARETGTTGSLADQLALVWLSATLATVAGAVGTGFESRDAVRQAAYGHRQRERQEREDDARGTDT
jgi:p-aminobenzoyl-glutamate transporter AbgT